MRRATLIGAALLSWPACGNTAELPADIAAAASAFDAAQVAGDRQALERLVADDYLLINSHGETETKADLIRDYTTPGFKLDPFTVRERVTQLWPDGAVLGGVVTLTGSEKGMRYTARLRFADVWARRNGRWQLVYTQASPAPQR